MSALPSNDEWVGGRALRSVIATVTDYLNLIDPTQGPHCTGQLTLTSPLVSHSPTNAPTNARTCLPFALPTAESTAGDDLATETMLGNDHSQLSGGDCLPNNHPCVKLHNSTHHNNNNDGDAMDHCADGKKVSSS